MVCIVLFKIVDLLRSVDILAISFKSIKFTEEGFSEIRSPVKEKPLKQAKEFKYTHHANPKLCVVSM